MKNLLTSTLLTVIAVSFLMAAPKPAKQTNPPAADTTQTQTAKPKVHKKHTKATTSSTDAGKMSNGAPAPSTTAPKQ